MVSGWDDMLGFEPKPKRAVLADAIAKAYCVCVSVQKTADPSCHLLTFHWLGTEEWILIVVALSPIIFVSFSFPFLPSQLTEGKPDKSSGFWCRNGWYRCRFHK